MICVPKVAQGANVHANDLVLGVGAVMGAPYEGPLRVQGPQPQQAGAPEAILVVILDDHPVLDAGTPS